jgi:ABC-type phosphate transport system auxiliary subunit
MGLLGVLSSLKVDNLSDKEKRALKKALDKHKTTLGKVTKLVDGHLKTLDDHLKKLATKKKKKKVARSR